MRSRRVALVVAALLAVAGTVFPTRWAWSAPETRFEQVTASLDGPTALPFAASHVGVRWIGLGTDRLELRWTDGTAWSPWEHVDVAFDLSRDNGEASSRQVSGLLVTPGARHVEIAVREGQPTAVEVAAIDTVGGPRRLVPAGPAQATAAPNNDVAVPAPAVISRSEWGADESLRSGSPSFAEVTGLVVHHTVTSNSDPNPAATVRAIYSWHTQGNGWWDIGYNFLIDAQGRVYEGRYARAYPTGETPSGEDASGRGVIGAHAANNNTGSAGVALLGTFSDTAPTQKAMTALESLLAWKADRHEIDALANRSWSTGSKATIVGHRDVGQTECPGGQLFNQLPELRQRVADAIEAANNPRPTLGYRVLGRDTKTYNFGEAGPLLPTSLPPVSPSASLAVTPTGDGYWVLSGAGRVSTFGDATGRGSVENMKLNAAPVRLEPTPTGKGYWILGADGGVFSFGDAAFYGSTGNIKLNAPVVAMAATPTGAGYWLLAKDGGVFSFGDARFHGSTGNLKLNAPVVSMAPHPNGSGYWLQAEDGGIFSFGVRFRGSVPGLGVKTDKAVQIRATGAGRGYYVLNADGGIFSFGDATFHGAQPGLSGTNRAVDLALLIGEERPAGPTPTTSTTSTSTTSTTLR
ncbi:MAG: peptidoglycan recognition protein family protein [Acidimicrobiales bacterium]